MNVKLEAVSSDFDNTNGDGIYEGGFADWEIPADAAIMPLFGEYSYTLESEDMLMTTIDSTQQLTLTTTPSTNWIPTATWTSSNTAVATVDSATGVVTAVGNGTATITALTVDGQTVTKEVIVAPVGTTFTVTGSTTLWRVLTTDGDNALIITEYVYGVGTKYNATENKFLMYESSNIKTVMDTWYNTGTNVGSTIKARALDYAYQDATGNSVAKQTGGTGGAGIEYDFDGSNYTWNTSANSTTHLRAITKAGTTSSTEPVFALSVSEANTYMNTVALRIAYDATAPTTTKRGWWLRSPGDSSYPASGVNAGGDVDYGSAAYAGSGFRAALWINR